MEMPEHGDLFAASKWLSYHSLAKRSNYSVQRISDCLPSALDLLRVSTGRALLGSTTIFPFSSSEVSDNRWVFADPRGSQFVP
jgi:hypothetical protein